MAGILIPPPPTSVVSLLLPDSDFKPKGGGYEYVYHVKLYKILKFGVYWANNKCIAVFRSLQNLLELHTCKDVQTSVQQSNAFIIL